MKRKIVVMLTVMSLVISVFTMNALAYNTSSKEKVGSVTNSSAKAGTAYGKLNPSGGYGEFQICNASGNTIYARNTYPTYPVNPNETTYPIPAGSTYSFYAHSLNGNQIWGTASFGMR
ncbi:MAG: hypothetical protein MJ166_06770 [Clostridia bacterium]|nr:hypothetical protein [Clostridia bacterium]